MFDFTGTWQTLSTWVDRTGGGVPATAVLGLVVVLAIGVIWYRKVNDLSSGVSFSEFFRYAFVTTLAASLAWLAASAFGSAVPAAAAVGAILSVSPNIGSSYKEAAIYAVGSATGLSVAVLLGHGFGNTVLSVGLTVFTTLLIAKLLGLPAPAQVSIPVVSLFGLAAAADYTDQLLVDRLAVTLVGVIIGVVLSPFAGRPAGWGTLVPRKDAVLSRMAVLLKSMAITPHVTVDLASSWLEESRVLVDEVNELSDDFDQLATHVRYSFRGSVKDLNELGESLTVARHTSQQVNTIARAMLQACVSGIAISSPVRSSLSAAAGLLDTVAGHGDVDFELQSVLSRLNSAAGSVKNLDDTGELILGSDILSNTFRIAQQIRLTPDAQVAIDSDTDLPQTDVVPPILSTPTILTEPDNT